MTRTALDPACHIAKRLLLLGKRFGRKEGGLVRVVHDQTLEEISLFAGVAPETIAATSVRTSRSRRDWLGR